MFVCVMLELELKLGCGVVWCIERATAASMGWRVSGGQKYKSCAVRFDVREQTDCENALFDNIRIGKGLMSGSFWPGLRVPNYMLGNVFFYCLIRTPFPIQFRFPPRYNVSIGVPLLTRYFQ